MNTLLAPRPATAASLGRILVVDDTPANIQTLTAILKTEGYQISVAVNRAAGATFRADRDLSAARLTT